MMSDKTLVAVVVLMSSCSLQAYFDDASCNNADAACIEELWNILKIKRISNIHLGEWQGQKRITASNDSTSGGKKFCIFASSNTSTYSRRQVRDYTVRLNGGQAVLRMSGGSEIPITLKLVGIGSGNGRAFSEYESGLPHGKRE